MTYRFSILSCIAIISFFLGQYFVPEKTCPPCEEPVKYPYMEGGCVVHKSQGRIIRTCG
jgi:hypothetical protein